MRDKVPQDMTSKGDVYHNHVLLGSYGYQVMNYPLHHGDFSIVAVLL